VAGCLKMQPGAEDRQTLRRLAERYSEIAGNPQNLTQWAATVDAVIERYYPR